MYSQKSTAQRIIDQFVFTQLEVLMQVIFVGGLVLYGVYKVLEQTSQEVREFGAFFENTVTRFLSETVGELIVRIATADIATLLLWAIVGAFVYVGATAVINGARGAGFTLVSALRYKHPQGFSTVRFLLDVITEKTLMVIGVFVFILYTSSLINTMVPYVFEQTSGYIAIVSSRSFWAVTYLLSLVLALHIWFVLLRLVRGLHKHEDADLLQTN